MKAQLVGLLGALVVAGLGCKKENAAGKIEAEIRHKIEGDMEVSATVSCPNFQIGKRGRVSTCTVNAGDLTFLEEVTQDDDAGSVHFRPKGVASPFEIGLQIERTAKARFPDAKVNCLDQRIRLATKGDVLPCWLTAGTTYERLTIEITDDYGGWRLKTETADAR